MLQRLVSQYPRPKLELGWKRVTVPYPTFPLSWKRTNEEPAGLFIYRWDGQFIRGGVVALRVYIDTENVAEELLLQSGELKLFALQPGILNLLLLKQLMLKILS